MTKEDFQSNYNYAYGHIDVVKYLQKLAQEDLQMNNNYAH